MIALDTNVLVRFLVEDDPSQTQRARDRLQEVIDADGRCFVSEIVLCELVWVLESSYRVRRLEILEKLRKLIQSRHLFFSDVGRVSTALDAYESGRGDFSDYLIREEARSAGCEIVVTFDAALHQDAGFADV